MDTFRVKLLDRQEVAERTVALWLEKPPKFRFQAGQFVDLTLIDPPETDLAGSTRTFTLACAPEDERLRIATRLRDTAFKRSLTRLPRHAELLLEGPMGSFTLHANTARPAVFLAGGIGITPFLSIVRHATQQQLPHEIFLFYSNRRPQDAAFLDELTELAQQNPRLHFIPTMTQPEQAQPPWQGETGYISIEKLSKYLPSLQGPIYYIAGPPPMVGAMRQLLEQAGVSPDDVRSEDFAGY